MGFAILYAARMFWWVCQLYSANHCCSQLIPGMFWTKQHGLHSCAPACVSRCAADEPRDVFTSLIRRARTKIALIAQQLRSCFPASQIFLVFLLQKSVPSQSLRTCRSLQNIGVIFWCFAGERSSAKRPKNCACSAGYHHYKPQILHVNGRTAKASSWEPFHAIWHVEIALVIENSNLSYLHVLMHVITVGDVRCDWLKCNAIRMIKVQREQ